MVIDTVNNAQRYELLHPLFKKALDYIRQTDLLNTPAGTYTIEENAVKAIVSEASGKKAEVSLEKFECHNQFIDIQYVISGMEQMGWKPRGDCHAPNGDYNPEKDVQFYNDRPDTFFTLSPGQFVIFFPEDVHAPMIGEGIIKKLVMKIKL
ncbi:YhcH/YjgK/YiaL family protein [Niabella drilacis]|uniref:YhcH/YjgK/YiaL family protein n=1 Tax=Niabella drilacis (strain DSM 25811 / CCM 8410 / CCUG 62505 / LMG 26954 / E90) TaxID=1285928 RepID=A0A1G6SA45_NIADE|nr:YhcH/YjgK/YiaL family protein [Niabella drilacis]SDD13782.1 YhcH/YjgK/YiaL family protein [Niabella drilacis]